ncbi:uncharacterized protein LOC141795257 [Halichoeres trimaculatus]|uniref:uncharacterized protein LOC141795257 n=1 Tax=Halichoeres trimaculatus TaxID=147232 RepID=UPI003D9EA9D8
MKRRQGDISSYFTKKKTRESDQEECENQGECSQANIDQNSQGQTSAHGLPDAQRERTDKDDESDHAESDDSCSYSSCSSSSSNRNSPVHPTFATLKGPQDISQTRAAGPVQPVLKTFPHTQHGHENSLDPPLITTLCPLSLANSTLLESPRKEPDQTRKDAKREKSSAGNRRGPDPQVGQQLTLLFFSQAEKQKLQTIKDLLQTIKDLLQTIEDLLKSRTLNPGEKKKVVSKFIKALDSLKRKFLLERDEHLLLHQQGLDAGVFDPEQELEGLLFSVSRDGRAEGADAGGGAHLESFP